MFYNFIWLCFSKLIIKISLTTVISIDIYDTTCEWGKRKIEEVIDVIGFSMVCSTVIDTSLT
jgi:hypothetical protein